MRSTRKALLICRARLEKYFKFQSKYMLIIIVLLIFNIYRFKPKKFNCTSFIPKAAQYANKK